MTLQRVQGLDLSVTFTEEAMEMPEIDLKEGIKLEVPETETISESECGSGDCGCGCGSEQEATDQLVTVVAGGSAEGCCEPGCSPETCGSAT